MTDLIRKSDALYAIAGWDIPSTAIAALPAVTAGVKPLVWQHEARNGWKVGVAWTTGYHIIRRDDGWHYGNGAGGIFPTIEAAKAAAQADYTARILAALEPVAAPDPAAPTYWSSAPPPEENLAHRALKAGCDVEWNTQTGVVTIKPTPDAIDPAAIREAALLEALEIAMACERQNYARVTDSGHHSHYRAGLRSAGQAISAAIKSRIAKGAAE